jgi:hypothetical protein
MGYALGSVFDLLSADPYIQFLLTEGERCARWTRRYRVTVLTVLPLSCVLRAVDPTLPRDGTDCFATELRVARGGPDANPRRY